MDYKYTLSRHIREWLDSLPPKSLPTTTFNPAKEEEFRENTRRERARRLAR